MSKQPVEQYLELMSTIRKRLDMISVVKQTDINPFVKAETCAFHSRKVIEGIAFGCLVAVENGLKQIPRDAKGQWNAENIFKNLQRKKLKPFPSPSKIRAASAEEKDEYPGIKIVIEGIPALRIRRNELIAIYSKLHKWLHETNPYTDESRDNFLEKYEERLWDDLMRIESFIERHTISMSGEMFFTTLRDQDDGQTKVLPLTKSASLVANP